MPCAKTFVGSSTGTGRLFSVTPGIAMDTVDMQVWRHYHSADSIEGARAAPELSDSKSGVAMYIDKSGNASTREDASLYYACTLNGMYGHCDVNMSLYGAVTRCKLMTDEVEQVSHVYVYIDQDICPIYASPLVVANAAFSGKYEYDSNRPASFESLSMCMGKAKGIRRRAIKEHIRRAYSEKISAQHHEHFRAEEMWAVVNQVGRERARVLGGMEFDMHHAMLAGLLLWINILPDELWHFVAGTDLFECKSIEEFRAKGKKLGVRAKQMQNLLDTDLRPLFEIDVLVNRIVTEMDWDTERKNREEPSLCNLGYDEIYQSARDIFSRRDSTIQKPDSIKWVDFWRSRWQWSAAGSTFITDESDRKYHIKDRRFSNKFVTLNLMPDCEIDKFLSREPRLDGRSSIKYEWGKVRAIYGCDLTSYILSTFAFSGCEDSLPAEFPVGRKATARYVSGIVSGVLDDALPFTLDFEDFNSQHSTSSMKAVLNAWLDVHASRLSKDQLDAGEWTVKSLDSMTVYNNLPQTSYSYRAKGTLLSGWRLTSFVNTVLNKIYTLKLIGASQTNIAIHNGDDVLIGTRNLKVAFNALKRSTGYGIRLQPTKTSFGSIAEFLRIDHKSKDGGQYMTRSIATLTHSRVESGPASDLRSAVESFESRYSDFYARTGRLDLIIRMRNFVERRLARIFRTKLENIEELRITHRVCGGLNDSPDALTKAIFSISSEELEEDVEEEKKRVAKAPGINSYAQDLADRFEARHLTSDFKKKLREATLNACSVARKRLIRTDNPDEQLSNNHKALYKAHSYLNRFADYGKAKLVGFSFNLLTKHENAFMVRRHLRGSKDPVRLLSVLT